MPSFSLFFPCFSSHFSFSNGYPPPKNHTKTYHHLPQSSQSSETSTKWANSLTALSYRYRKNTDLTFSDRPKLSIASKLLYEARDVGFALWRVLEADEELMCAAAPKQQAGTVFLRRERRRNGPYDKEDLTIMFFFIFNNGEFERNVSVAYEWCGV
ncbi:hypothetical protein LOK49_LG04G02152 [Camellia lanceoleosa]|uniref:Uncharacterized protein n=1 Tax=Camellia lanceoleosa TaxID=1840588 RepID=A0ACC0I1L3_9ERIC|nr:hypothetical protein LOK49_LG04G02152 [Camellia lanceoleosa]